ncbi:MAG: cytochrome b/b6 domain-containing protein [Dehalococcoidia bacterium]|nr:cytochrome b/b6 domain-containing protein [Dehalococcoidia bacterium]
MMEQSVQKYTKVARIFHWVHTGAFLLLVITGIFLFVNAGFVAQDSWSRLLHRIAAVIFVVAPFVQLFANRKTAVASLKSVFTWGVDDLKWAMAMPRYYFLADEEAMPPQDEMNTGQKMWYFIIVVLSPIFVITGILMWFFGNILPSAVFQWSVFVHDVAFIFIFLMFLVHIYLGVIHPLMRQHGGSFRSMVDGTVTAEYAKSHHGKWYERIIKK